MDIGFSFIKKGLRGPCIRVAFRAGWRFNQAIAQCFWEKGPKCPHKCAKAVGFSAKPPPSESHSTRKRLGATLSLALMPRQPAFGIQSSHAAHTGAGNCLAVDMIGQIARGKDPRNGCSGAAGFDLNIAAVM